MDKLKELIEELRNFRLCGPGDDPDEQLRVINGYRRLLGQLKMLAAPILTETDASNLNALNVDFNDLNSVYDAKVIVDDILPRLDFLIDVETHSTSEPESQANPLNRHSIMNIGLGNILFSDRSVHKPFLKPQSCEATEELRLDIWNAILIKDRCVFSNFSVWVSDGQYGHSESGSYIRDFLENYSLQVGGVSPDQFTMWKSGETYPALLHEFKEYLLSLEWWGFYDFLEFYLTYMNDHKFCASKFENPNSVEPPAGYGSCLEPSLIPILNRILSRHNAQYQIIGQIVVPVSQGPEAEAVETAISAFCPEFIRDQMLTAIKSARSDERSELRRSCTESANAVEGLLQKITGKNRSGVAPHVDYLIEKKGFNPLIGEAIKKFYGWIHPHRHTEKETPVPVSPGDARLALHLASAFVSYLLDQFFAE